MFELTSVLCFGVVSIFFCYAIYDFIKRVLDLSEFVPATQRWPIVGTSFAFIGLKREEIIPKFVSLIQRCGDNRSMCGFEGVYVYHPETVEPLVTSNEHIRKSKAYELLHEWLGNGLVISTGKAWKLQRKLLTPAFHYKILEDALEVCNKQANVLVNILREDGALGEPLNVVAYLKRCTMDTVIEVALGTELMIQLNKESEYISATETVCSLSYKRALMRWLHSDFIYGLTSMKKLETESIKVIDKLCYDVIRKKRAELSTIGHEFEKTRPKFIDILLQNTSFSDKEIRDQINTFVFGGHDTTAILLTWTFLLLANYPDVQRKLFEEQVSIFGSDRDCDVTSEKIAQMTYLNCVLKESMRLYPPLPFFNRLLEKEMTIDGKKIPPGYDVYVFLYYLHRNPTVWERPEEFIPERFLSGSSQESKHHPMAFLPFSAGPRNCIGQRLALMEAKTIMSKILRALDLRKADSIEDVKPVTAIVTAPHKEVNVYIKERSN